MSEFPLLGCDPVKNGAWYEQIKDNISNSKRFIDKMSLAEINAMYKQREFICDGCGKHLDSVNFKLNKDTFEKHIIHLINPLFYWVCEDCIHYELKNGNVIAMTEDKDEEWQIENR